MGGVDGEKVSIDRFVELLAYVAMPVTEKSVMKLEACVNALQRRQMSAETAVHRLEVQLASLEWRNRKSARDIMGKIEELECRDLAFHETQRQWQEEEEARRREQEELLKQM